MDDRPRALAKTLTFALLHFGVAFSVAYLLTGSIAVATGVGLIEPLVNTVAFYLHERAWRRAERGRATKPSAPGIACCGIVRAR